MACGKSDLTHALPLIDRPPSSCKPRFWQGAWYAWKLLDSNTLSLYESSSLWDAQIGCLAEIHGTAHGGIADFSLNFLLERLIVPVVSEWLATEKKQCSNTRPSSKMSVDKGIYVSYTNGDAEKNIDNGNQANTTRCCQIEYWKNHG